MIYKDNIASTNTYVVVTLNIALITFAFYEINQKRLTNTEVEKYDKGNK